MILILIVLMLAAWYAVGVAGFVFWWTRVHDLKGPDLAFGLFIGLLGLFTWLFGYMDIDRRDRPPLIRRRWGVGGPPG